MRNTKKRLFIVVGILILILLITSIILYKSGIIDTENELIGNNTIASYYEEVINAPKYNTVEEALKDKDDNYNSESTVATITSGNVTIVLQRGTEEFQGQKRVSITGYEFVHKQSYTYSGDRKLLIDALKDNVNCSWEETFRADLSQTSKKSYQKLRQRYEALPAWGISDQENVKDVLIEGQGIDQMITIPVDGKDYYLWILNDLKTDKNAKDVEISGM